jgi:hypothetical protein
MPPPLPPGADFAAAPLFADASYWLHLPVLILVVSLVYGATRYDDWAHILREARRWVVRLTGFLLVIVLILYLLAIQF